MALCIRFLLVAAIAGVMAGGCARLHAGGGASPGGLREVEHVLDELHARASSADFDGYFTLFAPDAVFLGTDPNERWTVEEFRSYTRPYFERGQGWTYIPRARHVSFSADGRTAWFDELLDNAKYGECRGTGVLVRPTDGRWRIATYSLTKVIPNERMEAVVRAIRAEERDR